MSISNTENTIHLAAGDIFFGKGPAKLTTVLGSCAALTTWHSKLKVGGMCHYLIAEHKQTKALLSDDFKYGEVALEYLYQQMAILAPVHEFQLHLYGGANMYDTGSSPTIGEKNIAFANNWLRQKGLQVCVEETLGTCSRKLQFELVSGDIEVINYAQARSEVNNGN